MSEELTPEKVREWLKDEAEYVTPAIRPAQAYGRRVAVHADWLRLHEENERLRVNLDAQIERADMVTRDSNENAHAAGAEAAEADRLRKENERLRALDHPHEAFEEGLRVGHEVGRAGLPREPVLNPYPKPDDPPRPQLSRDAVVECVLETVRNWAAKNESFEWYNRGHRHVGYQHAIKYIDTNARADVAAALAKLEVE